MTWPEGPEGNPYTSEASLYPASVSLSHGNHGTGSTIQGLSQLDYACCPQQLTGACLQCFVSVVGSMPLQSNLQSPTGPVCSHAAILICCFHAHEQVLNCNFEQT